MLKFRQAMHDAVPVHFPLLALFVLQVHKTTLHRDGGLKELTFFPR